ncbi:MAG: DegQ family serine endoprotease [Pseudomonadota bacterium]
MKSFGDHRRTNSNSFWKRRALKGALAWSFLIRALAALSLAIATAANAQTASVIGQAVSPISPSDRVAPQTMGELQMSFAPIVQQAAPAVVNIYTKRVTRSRPLTGDPLFDRFFSRMTPREQSSLGSGVIVSPDGVIVTNNHVIENMTEIKVVFADRREFEAELILADPKTDLAVLRISTDDSLPFLNLANSDALEVGDLVLAIGNPFGVGQTVTSGIVSALARTAVSISDYQFFIQTDAAINPGNSGGALVDVNGDLVGVNTAIYSRSGGSIGIGFAVPSRLVRQVIAKALNGGDLSRPWFGASTSTLTAPLARAMNIDRPAGALIEDVWRGGPAARAGLKAGDVVVEIDGKPVYDAETLRYRIGVLNDGDVASLAYIRKGETRQAKITAVAPPETPARDQRALSGSHPLNGVTVANLSPKFNEEFDLNPLLTGVVVTNVRLRSYASRSRLRTNSRILSVNGRRVETTKALEQEMQRPARRWRIEVDTGDRVVEWTVDP